MHTGSTEPLFGNPAVFWLVQPACAAERSPLSFHGGAGAAVGQQQASRPHFSSLTRSADVFGLRALTDIFIPGLIQASAAVFFFFFNWKIWRLRENTAMI